MYFSHNNKNGLQAATTLYLFMKIVDDILESVVLDILKYCLFQRNVFLTAYNIWRTTKFNFYLKTKAYICNASSWKYGAISLYLIAISVAPQLLQFIQNIYIKRILFLKIFGQPNTQKQICHIGHINIFYCCFSMTSLWEKVFLPVISCL